MPPGSLSTSFRLWWRRRGAAFALALLAAALLLALSRYAAVPSASPSPSYGHRLPTLVDLTLVYDRGAVCLDGTPPGYHFLPGFGEGSHSWLLHLEGGSWCPNLKSCARRQKTSLGSSAYMDSRVDFVGILSDDESQNPDFYNWNKVKIRYCDGASFSGNVQDQVKNGTGFFFRGQRIWEAVMADLLSKGLSRAKQAFLTGCSAGGLSTYIHCDDFQALLPKTPTVKCLADGGFFLDVEDISGRRYMRAFYNDVARLQDVRKKFPHCRSDMEPGQCFFPREVAKSITTPMFILNPAYDYWQVEHVLSPEGSDPQNLWRNCRVDITKCSSKQLEILQGFRKALLDAIDELKNRRDWGMFIDSCFIHCQSMKAITWHSPSATRINNKTVAEAVGDWFFDRREVKEIDCEYPCNPTCYNAVLDKPYKEDWLAG
ncbi:Pectin acetylesterase 5 [Dichanthelium oligosanthes]|uniref:Pectin acetylesterase n=1 Tax=Dichanthelium oligosanthes TaxID=888268 RepID=A0A1E5WI87_9POAL|nr:Pectin acetylesterase 5 [Dichanthelium oligosanthes]